MNVKGRPLLGSGLIEVAKHPFRCRWPTCEALDIHLSSQTIGRRG